LSSNHSPDERSEIRDRAARRDRPAFALVIFDLDGTLADSSSWFLTVINGVAREYGFRQIADREIELLRHAGAREILHHLEVPRWKLPAIARRMRALKREQLDTIFLFPGVPAMLQALRDAGLTLTLVSSDNEDNARRQLGESAALFRHFACGASIFGKAAKFKAVMRRARVTAAQTIAIGDEVRDIEAARAAGIACGAATWGYAAAEALVAMKPELVFERMNDIVARLAS
jgi:phosphoglycolate phosphatase